MAVFAERWKGAARYATRLFAAALLFAGPAAAEERVSFPSFDGAGNAPVVLTGYFFAASASANGPAPAGAIVLFHGCSGAFEKSGALSERLRRYAELFVGLGLHALVVDSLTPRYEKELCTQRLGKRRVTQVNRRRDALGALAYLAARPDVDPARIGVIGWSNGGSTVLSATNLRHPDVGAARIRPAFAIAFYPGCEAELGRGYEAAAPLLLLVGEADDWTPAGPCRALARAATGTAPEIEVYAGAGHGFDSAAPVRLRTDVPNGVRPSQGVHVGGNAAAWSASRERLLRFVARQ